MAVVKRSISFDPEILAAAEDQANGNLSALVNEALAAELRRRNLQALVDEYEAEHGAFTEEEIRAAEVKLGWVDAPE